MLTRLLITAIIVLASLFPTRPVSAAPPPPFSDPDPAITVYSGKGNSEVEFTNFKLTSIARVWMEPGPSVIFVRKTDDDVDLIMPGAESAYYGVHLLNNSADRAQGRFVQKMEIVTKGAWRIEIMRVRLAREIPVSTEITGTGNEVLVLPKSNAWAVSVTVRVPKGMFTLNGYGQGANRLVSTNAALIAAARPNEAINVLEILSEGEWIVKVE